MAYQPLTHAIYRDTFEQEHKVLRRESDSFISNNYRRGTVPCNNLDTNRDNQFTNNGTSERWQSRGRKVAVVDGMVRRHFNPCCNHNRCANSAFRNPLLCVPSNQQKPTLML